jgi:hypothetical protein
VFKHKPLKQSRKKSGCEKTSSNLESILGTTKEQSQIWDSQEVDFSFFTD